jgi:hypothetical protein
MNILSSNDDCEFARYFKNLGYGYSWDCSGGESWHELYENDELVLQIEMVDLDDIIKDFCNIKPTKTDWFVCGMEEDYQKAIKKVREFEKNKAYDLQSGQPG